MALSDKITNIIGVVLPDWVLKQFRTRSKQSSLDGKRSNANLVYLENKTAWIRLVSSVNTPEKSDQDYFRNLGIDIKDQTSLAKEFVLFGGTSKYLNKNSYKTRSGISTVTPNLPKDGQYGILGEKEINKYGFRPMPGITSVNIETQGRLGSIRAATVNFKCWDKFQLDIIDTLYFKLGYTAFLEWGHTFYYDSKSETLKSTELYSIDPFDSDLSKEEISRRVAKNNRETEGNYDAMLGMITNFNFSYNQDGGYDCTVKIIGLGILAESIKINNSTLFVNMLTGEIERSNLVVKNIIAEQEIARAFSENNGIDVSKLTADQLASTIIKYDPKRDSYYNTQTKNQVNEIGTFIYPYDKPTDSRGSFNNADVFVQNLKILSGSTESVVILRKLNSIAHLDKDKQKSQFVQLDSNRLLNFIGPKNKYGINLKDKEDGWPGGVGGGDYNLEVDFLSNNRPYTVEVKIDPFTSAKFIAPGQEELNKLFGGQVKIETLNVATIFDSKREEALLEILNEAEGLKSQEPNSREDDLQESIDSLYQQIASNTYWPLEIQYGTVTIPADRTDARGSKDYTVVTFTVIVDVYFTAKADISAEYIDENKEEQSDTKLVTSVYKLPVKITFNDTSLIRSFKSDSSQDADERKAEQDLEDQDQVEIPETEDQDQDQSPAPQQTDDPYRTSSNLELILRTIQLYSLSQAREKIGDIDLRRRVEKISLWDPITAAIIGDEAPFYRKIFSEGIFSDFIKDLVEGNISSENYENVQSEYERFKINSKYGFATNLMSGYSNISNFKPVNFKELLNSYVIPYTLSADIKEGSATNYPVYISFGQLLMILNSVCTLYENSKDVKRPVIYIDFNPNHNFCFSNPQQLSIDPWTAMIPFQGDSEDYRQLFPTEILQKKVYPFGGVYYRINIQQGSGSVISDLFSPTPVNENNGDRVSKDLPYFKYDGETTPTSAYRGKIMNILLNIDYLIDVVKRSASNEGENKVFLKQFIETILVDVNRSLGNVNFLRLAYEDAANCLQIVDDQVIPATDENQLQRSTTSENCELPLIGKFNIAKSLEIKTEVSTRLSSLIAISANANAVKNAAGTDGENFGFINYKYTDRYIPNRYVADEKTEKNEINTEGYQNSAIQFNNAVLSIYGISEISKTQTEGSINYYLERMTENKSQNENSKGSAMIPVSLNMKTDGISGLTMGHAFTIPEELMPYTYSVNRILPYTKRPLNKVGFVVMGLTHNIEGNVWDTSLKANMIFLKENSNYTISKFKPEEKTDASQKSIDAAIRARTSQKTYYPELTLVDPPKQDFLTFSSAKQKLTQLTDSKTAKIVFGIMWAEAAKTTNQFKSAGGYNYTGIQTDSGRWGGLDSLFIGRYVRVDSGNVRREFAQFNSNEDFLRFMIEKVKQKKFTSEDPNAWATRYLDSWVFLNLSSQDKRKFDQLFPEKVAIYKTASNTFDRLA